MNTKYLLVLGVVAACTGPAACSSKFDSCIDTRTCPEGGSDGKGEAGEGAEAGDPGSVAGNGGAAAGATNSDAGAAGGDSAGAGGSDAGASGSETGGTDTGGAGQSTGGIGGTAGGGAVDTVAPTILSITPTNGATNLTPATDVIVITFSEPMQTGETAKLYLPAIGGTTPVFSWNATHTVLTIDPKISYPAAEEPGLPATPFSFTITTAAKDLAGNPIAANVNWQFTLLREITQAIGYSYGGSLSPPKYNLGSFILVGDLNSPTTEVEARGVMAYDFTGLPDGIQTIESATITAQIVKVQADALGIFGNMQIRNVAYTTPPQALFNAPILHDLGTFMAATGTNAAGDSVSKDVLVAFKDDYANRVARSNFSTYQLLFASTPHLDGVDQFVQILNKSASNKLVVKYLFP